MRGRPKCNTDSCVPPFHRKVRTIQVSKLKYNLQPVLFYIGVADELLVHYRGGVGKAVVGTLEARSRGILKGMRFKAKKRYLFYIYEEQGCTRAADEVEATTPHVDNVYRCRHMRQSRVFICSLAVFLKPFSADFSSSCVWLLPVCL